MVKLKSSHKNCIRHKCSKKRQFRILSRQAANSAGNGKFRNMAWKSVCRSWVTVKRLTRDYLNNVCVCVSVCLVSPLPMTSPHFSAGTENVVSSPKPLPNRTRLSNIPSIRTPALGQTCRLPAAMLPCLCCWQCNMTLSQSLPVFHFYHHYSLTF